MPPCTDDLKVLQLFFPYRIGNLEGKNGGTPKSFRFQFIRSQFDSRDSNRMEQWQTQDGVAPRNGTSSGPCSSGVWSVHIATLSYLHCEIPESDLHFSRCRTKKWGPDSSPGRSASIIASSSLPPLDIRQQSFDPAASLLNCDSCRPEP
jgi:hypothetical protein